MKRLNPDGCGRVDIVISDAAVRESTRILLEVHEFEGHDYTSGKDYILAGAHDADCLITDRVLSDMTGLDLLEHLRTCGEKTPAVMLTGFTAPEMIERAKHLSLKLLDKPALSDSLLRSIHDASVARDVPPASPGGAVKPRVPAASDAFDARHPNWIENVGTGVAIFDAEHRLLNEMAIDFYGSVLAGESQAVLNRQFKALAAHAVKHIAREEDYMRFAGYPEIESHAAAHQQMLKALADARLTTFHHDENRSARALAVLRFFKDLLLDHFRSDDRKLGSYLNGCNIH